MRLEDRIAIVTGASQGIGLAVAETFSSEGAHVVIADTNDELGKEAAGGIDNAMFVQCDVSNADDVSNLVQETLKAHGRVDICVNNAGILRTGDVLEISEEDFMTVLDVNLKGAFLVSQAVAREMVKQGSGCIINMSSTNAILTIPAALPYVVSKGGLNQLTRCMGVALASRGVRVNAIGPGSVMTEMLKENIFKNEEARRQVLSRTPMGRAAEVGEIARIAVFLASEDSSYITGQTIYADGGRLPLAYVVPVAEDE